MYSLQNRPAFLTDLSSSATVTLGMSPTFRRLLAWCALLAFTVTFGLGAGMLGHSGPDDDAACQPGLPTGAHAGVQVTAATETTPPTHCPFCHWQRTVGGGQVVVADLAVAPLHPLDTLVAIATRAIGSTAVDERPSRAPPLTIVS